MTLNNQKSDHSLPLSSGPGSYLYDIRCQRKLPGDPIRQQLGLTNRLFNALENDDLESLPSPVYVKGYLRRYAEALGVRPAPVLTRYQQLLEQQGLAAPTELTVRPDNTFRPYFSMFVTSFAMLLATSVVFGAMMVDSGDTSTNNDFSDDGKPLMTTLANNVNKSSHREADFNKQDFDKSKSTAKLEHQLQLEFIADSWVEVVDAKDHILTVSLQRSGTHLSLEGQPPFNVNLGYGPGVVLTYLDKPVDLSFDPETYAVEITVGR